MATVVTIMDREFYGSNTDVIVVADPARELLLWVPRDLWCPALGDRVNRAFRIGRHEALSAALAEHGIAAEHGLCLARASIEAGLEGVEIVMPVEREMAFWYPRTPTSDIREARKRIEFTPPIERLAGERIHQWIGARKAIEPRNDGDLARIRRQQQLIAVLLGDGFDFDRFLAPGRSHILSSQAALDELARVRPDWRFETFGPLRDARVDGKAVLVPAGPGTTAGA